MRATPPYPQRVFMQQHLDELLRERGLEVDHTTIRRWVARRGSPAGRGGGGNDSMPAQHYCRPRGLSLIRSRGHVWKDGYDVHDGSHEAGDLPGFFGPLITGE